MFCYKFLICSKCMCIYSCNTSFVLTNFYVYKESSLNKDYKIILDRYYEILIIKNIL